MSVEKINNLVEVINNIYDFINKDEYFKKDTNSKSKLENTREKLINRKYTVSVIAAMKAGKSTTFNALIGRDLLPNERAACTASITEIKHSNNIKDSIEKIYTDGSKENIIAENDKTLEEMFHEDVRNSRKTDGVKKIEKYYVETPIKALEGTDYKDLIQNFVLIDTPGPNEASTGEFDTKLLQKLALEQLRNSDALIMLLDYESYKSDVNETILKDIFDNRNDLKDDEGKVFFLLNKIDSMGSKDGTLEEVIEDVKKLITKNTKIENPNVFGLSGKQAMLSRCVINGTANEDMKRDMKASYGNNYSEVKVIDGEEYTVIPSVDKFADKILKESNIENIENRIISNIFKRASIDMLNNGFNKSEEVIFQILNDTERDIISLTKDSDELKMIIQNAIENLNDVKNKCGRITKLPEIEFNRVRGEVQTILTNLEENIGEIVIAQFPESNILESFDRESLAERIEFIRMNTIGAVQAYVNGEVDKVQRICINAQGKLNNNINIEFNKLVREATENAKSEINLTPRAFDINEAIESYNSEYNIDTEYENYGRIEVEEFTALGATFGTVGGIAMGAAVGSVVPIVGTIVGAVIGGIIGLIFGSKKTEVREQEREVFKADISELRENILNLTREAVVNAKEQVNEGIDKFVENYSILVTRVVNNYIVDVEKEYNEIIERKDLENFNKEEEIKHLAEIKMEMARFIDELEKIK